MYIHVWSKTECTSDDCNIFTTGQVASENVVADVHIWNMIRSQKFMVYFMLFTHF